MSSGLFKYKTTKFNQTEHKVEQCGNLEFGYKFKTLQVSYLPRTHNADTQTYRRKDENLHKADSHNHAVTPPSKRYFAQG